MPEHLPIFKVGSNTQQSTPQQPAVAINATSQRLTYEINGSTLDNFVLRREGDLYFLYLRFRDFEARGRVFAVFKASRLVFNCDLISGLLSVVCSEKKEDIALAFQKAATICSDLRIFFGELSNFLEIDVTPDKQFSVSTWFPCYKYEASIEIRLPDCYRQASTSETFVDSIYLHRGDFGVYWLGIGAKNEQAQVDLKALFAKTGVVIDDGPSSYPFRFGVEVKSKSKEGIIFTIQQLMLVELNLEDLLPKLSVDLVLESQLCMLAPCSVPHWFQQKDGSDVVFKQADRHVKLISAIKLSSYGSYFSLSLMVKNNQNRESSLAEIINIFDKNKVVVADFSSFMWSIRVESLKQADIALAIQVLAKAEPSLALLFGELGQFLKVKINAQAIYPVSRWFHFMDGYASPVYQQAHQAALVITKLALLNYVEAYTLDVYYKGSSAEGSLLNLFKQANLQIKSCDDKQQIIRVYGELSDISQAFQLLLSLEPSLSELLPMLGKYYRRKDLFRVSETKPKESQSREGQIAKPVVKGAGRIPLSQYYLFKPQRSGRRGSRADAQSRHKEQTRKQNTYHKPHR